MKPFSAQDIVVVFRIDYLNVDRYRSKGLDVTKVRIAKVSAKKSRGRRTIKKVFRAPNGRRTTAYTIDSTSKSFDADLVSVFKSNIDEARRANTAIFGSPDGPKDR
jgi:hypothetical protein